MTNFLLLCVYLGGIAASIPTYGWHAIGWPVAFGAYLATHFTVWL